MYFLNKYKECTKNVWSKISQTILFCEIKFTLVTQTSTITENDIS